MQSTHLSYYGDTYLVIFSVPSPFVRLVCCYLSYSRIVCVCLSGVSRSRRTVYAKKMVWLGYHSALNCLFCPLLSCSTTVPKFPQAKDLLVHFLRACTHLVITLSSRRIIRVRLSNNQAMKRSNAYFIVVHSLSCLAIDFYSPRRFERNVRKYARKYARNTSRRRWLASDLGGVRPSKPKT